MIEFKQWIIYQNIMKEVYVTLINSDVIVLDIKLVGSRSKSTHRENSDIDIAVQVPKDQWDKADTAVGTMSWQNKMFAKYGLFVDVHVKTNPIRS